jgi:hypothetical protein
LADTLTTVRRVRTVAFREVEGQMLIVLPRTQESFVLNGSGALVWQLSDGSHSVDDVVQQLVDRYDVGPETARADLEHLYRDLIGVGIAEPVA